MPLRSSLRTVQRLSSGRVTKHGTVEDRADGSRQTAIGFTTLVVFGEHNCKYECLVAGGPGGDPAIVVAFRGEPNISEERYTRPFPSQPDVGVRHHSEQLFSPCTHVSRGSPDGSNCFVAIWLKSSMALWPSDLPKIYLAHLSGTPLYLLFFRRARE